MAHMLTANLLTALLAHSVTKLYILKFTFFSR
jgi:hypothetical protein